MQTRFRVEGALARWKRSSFAVPWVMAICSAPLGAQVRANPPAMGIPDNPSVVGDNTGLAVEAQAWLMELIRVNTTNPPGNEQQAAKYIAGILSKEGIPA